MSSIVNFLKDESGVTAAEYALILSLIALVVIAGATVLGTSISGKLSTAATTIG
jgi:pilus assembly protein Flp/PilA